VRVGTVKSKTDVSLMATKLRCALLHQQTNDSS